MVFPPTFVYIITNIRNKNIIKNRQQLKDKQNGTHKFYNDITEAQIHYRNWIKSCETKKGFTFNWEIYPFKSDVVFLINVPKKTHSA